MSCRLASAGAPSARTLLTLRGRPWRLALVGNPNVGKSAIFGSLTGHYATVSNYPGTTVTVTQGRAVINGQVCEVIDTPGVNALEGVLSEDELISRQLILEDNLDVLVQVVDARNLRRGLMLTWQLARFRKPMVLVLNMVDEAGIHGLRIDASRLSAALGIPVVPTVATEGQGLQLLRDVLPASSHPVVDRSCGDRSAWAHELTEAVRERTGKSLARTQDIVGRLVRQPLTAIPILAGVLYLLYLSVGVFGAQTLVGLLEDKFFGGLVNPAARAAMEWLVPVELIRDMFVGEYGLVTMGLTYAIGIVLPVVTAFFVVFGILEDSGYIPRLAIFCDRIFRLMGLNGKAVLPMVLGLGCDTMATMTTRILGTQKERLIAILLLALGVPCSAQLATIMGILGGISFGALLTLFSVVLTQMFMIGFLAARVVPGARSEFILELPPIRLPVLRNVLMKTVLRVRWYLGEAVPLFLLGTLILFVMDRVGALVVLVRAGEPVIEGLLGLPPETTQVFVMGFLRRDYGAAGLFQLAQQGLLTGVQSVVALTVMTLFVPCIAHFLMIVKEQGALVAFLIFVVVTFIAVLTGTVLNHGFGFFQITF
jgi:ferrous iron transport protein B